MFNPRIDPEKVLSGCNFSLPGVCNELSAFDALAVLVAVLYVFRGEQVAKGY